jgi:hypothetical protein
MIKILYIFLSAVLMLCMIQPSQAQTNAYIIQKPDGSELLADADSPILGSTTVKVKKTGIAEGYIFPASPRGKKKYPPAEKIFTGVYSSYSKSETEPKNITIPKEVRGLENLDPDLAQIVKESGNAKDAETIAWITKEAETYHDPFLDCGSHTLRLWIKDYKALAGMEPCRECFHNTGNAPAFIRKECGGLDLATAGVLLDNAEFKGWVESHLPVKSAVFLTSRKMLIYPKQQMSPQGLKELAHETAMAYRRHTWKVIEVMAKNSEDDLENFSSF